MEAEPIFLLTGLFVFNTAVVFKTIALLILLICSALVSGAEVAFFSLTPAEVSAAAQTSSAAKGIEKLLSKPKKLLATILIANNFINIAVVLLFDALGNVFFSAITTPWVRVTLEVGVVTFLILMFGEILPKVYANRNKLKFASFMSGPLQMLDVFFSPFSIPMRNATVFLQKKLGKTKSNISVNQLSQALELTSEEDTTIAEQKILQGIVSFGNTHTKQVMRPRIDIFALQQDLVLSQVITDVLEKGYSRVPVYQDTIDKVTGVLYVKDLLPYLSKDDTFIWKGLIREPYFVPENKKLDDLLKEFQEMKNHLAIVVDEYGGTSGLVTLEDIIEEIVGDISDEFDDEDLIFSKLDDSTYVFDGKTTLRDFYKVLDLSDQEQLLFETAKGESETIAGFVLEISGSFPKKLETVNFAHVSFLIEVLDKRRLKQIKVTLSQQ